VPEENFVELVGKLPAPTYESKNVWCSKKSMSPRNIELESRKSRFVEAIKSRDLPAEL
jgi:hypothetical protein